MHFEILVEDQSGKAMLDILVPKVLGSGTPHTFKVIAYKGVGRIPKGLRPTSDADRRILLDQLPRLLAGYAGAFARYPPGYEASVVVVCDSDSRDPKAFACELEVIAQRAARGLKVVFCLAIEEGEAWFLGDFSAIRKAYPSAKETVLETYVNDTVCGTWELLADAVFPGGRRALAGQGYQRIGKEKTIWAKAITPFMDPEQNRSPSFSRFRKALCDFAGITA